MDLKIKDVAELLNVSETTIRRWLNMGKIPAYQINRQYRFSRLEIEDWVMSQKLGQQARASTPLAPSKKAATANNKMTVGSNQYSLYRALNKGGIYYDIPGTTKEEVIRNTTLRIAQEFNLDAEVLTDLLLDREKLMPTSLNNGIGVPHTRDFLLDTHFDIIALVFPQQPIDYGALDGHPVHALFFLFASEDKRHLHLLAKVAHLVSNPEMMEQLQQHTPADILLEYIKEWEGTLQPIS